MSCAKTLGVWTLLPVIALGAALSGCSDLYFDRRESISFGAGDAPATNKVSQMIDPWPAAAADKNLTYNGERMARAQERYRTNRTTPVSSINTSSVQYAPIMAAPPSGGATP